MPARKSVNLQEQQRVSSEDFTLVSEFKGFRAKEDKTNLPPGYLVVGSQNVLTNTASRLSIRGGYTLDGQADPTICSVNSAYDYHMSVGYTRHLRAGNKKLQFRYVASAGDYYNGTTFTEGQVYWIDLITSPITSDYFNFTNYWDPVNDCSFALFVNGDPDIKAWTGGVTTIASTSNDSGIILTLASVPTAGGLGYQANDILTIASGGTGATCIVVDVNGLGAVQHVTLLTNGKNYTAGAGKATTGGSGAGCTVNIVTTGQYSITKTGTSSWSDEGFAIAGQRSVVINGNIYLYQGGEGTTTIVGLSADPTAEPLQSVAFQGVKFTQNSVMTGIPATLPNQLIATLRNQVYVGALKSNIIYVSAQGDYTDYSYASPRAIGEGAQVSIDGAAVALIQQEDGIYISAGKDLWYTTQFINAADNIQQEIVASQLKTGAQQGPLSQYAVWKSPNDVIFISNEPVLYSFGRVDNILVTPQMSNLSDPIKDLMGTYDFTNASGIYTKYFLYVAVPAENRVLIWNIEKNFWEAPQVLPISRFSIIDGTLYGHSSEVLETYKLFDGYNDNGNPIEAIAAFSFNNFGSRTKQKYFNEWYTEGYISSNTTLTLGIQYEIDGCATNLYYDINGSDDQIVCLLTAENSLGKKSLGKFPLGGSLPIVSNALPPKMRGIKTFPRRDFYEMQVTYASIGVDQRWELLAVGPKVHPTGFGQNAIKQ